MEYEDFIDDVVDLDFIEDPDVADSAVKAVLGILTSTLDEPQARKLTESLPDPLSYDRLRGHQANPLSLSMDEYCEEVSAQLNLNPEQARELIDTVFHTTKEAVGEDVIEELEDDMPPEIAEEILNA